jgi:hypothetical protein
MTKLIVTFRNFAKASKKTVVNSVIAVNEFAFYASQHSNTRSGTDDEAKPWLEVQDSAKL